MLFMLNDNHKNVAAAGEAVGKAGGGAAAHGWHAEAGGLVCL
jgi:hypothetical protein